MEATLDLSRWREKPRGVAYRRWAMIWSGLDLLFRTKLFRTLIIGAWIAGTLIAIAGFVFSQSVASGGWLESLAAHAGARLHAVVIALGGFVTLYPDICVRGAFTLIFWVHSFVGLTLSLVALTIVVPRLVAQDRASNALTIYLSRPLTTTDYLLGKLGIIVATIVLTWTGPLVCGWLLSMLFATDRDFVYYSLEPLGRALAFNGIALVALAAIAFGVSAATRTNRSAISAWIGLWLIMATLASPPPAPIWLKRASFSHDLHEVRQTVLRIDSVLADAAEKLPLLDQQFAQKLARGSEKAKADDFGGALLGLGIMVILSSAVFLRRFRPE